MHIRRVVEAVDAQSHIGDKWRRMSDVSRKVRAGRRHGPRVAVPCRHDQTASPDRLRASRYSFFVDVCIVSLSGKSQSCVSVCNVEMQCLLAKWLILSLVLSFGTSLDRSCICADLWEVIQCSDGAPSAHRVSSRSLTCDTFFSKLNTRTPRFYGNHTATVQKGISSGGGAGEGDSSA